MNNRRLIVVASLAVFVMAAGACGGAADPSPTPTTAAPTATAVPTSVPTELPEGPSLPDTTGAAVWDYLEEVEYRTGWELWPGKGELYEGTEPHGMLLTTYLNDTAITALNEKAGSMPAGSIIVKENYMPDGTYDAATVMYKVDGYDSANNDWFWTKITADGSVEVEGRVESCAACHAARAENDYIYTGSLE